MGRPVLAGLAPSAEPTAQRVAASAEGLDQQPAADDRQVIFSAGLSVVVVSIAEARASVLALARSVGGHLQESDSASITVRVPAPSFDETVDRIAQLGELVDQNVVASDVTEELVDLDIRLENARRARERLLEHLAKSENIEATLKIEAELTRVTGEIEVMEGRKRFLASRVAMSTIQVQFNSTQPQGARAGRPVPFEWIARLGDGLMAGAVESQPRQPRFLGRGPRFDLPRSFLRYYQSSDLVEAMDADGLRIKVQRQRNYDKGEVDFWHKLARRSLVESRALRIDGERELDPERVLLRGTRDVAGQLHGYMLVLMRTSSRIYTLEAWGPLEGFEDARAALEASAMSLRP